MTEYLQRLANQVKDPAGVLKVIDLMRDRAQAGEIEKAMSNLFVTDYVILRDVLHEVKNH